MTPNEEQRQHIEASRSHTAKRLREAAARIEAGRIDQADIAALREVVERGVIALSHFDDQLDLRAALCEAHQALKAQRPSSMRAAADKLDPSPQIAGGWVSWREAADAAGIRGRNDRNALRLRFERWIRRHPGDVRVDEEEVARIPGDRAAELVTSRRRSRRRH